VVSTDSLLPVASVMPQPRFDLLLPAVLICFVRSHFFVFMKEVTEASVRRFLLDKYCKLIGAIGMISEEFADDFDFC
jgi:hypothetical protein